MNLLRSWNLGNLQPWWMGCPWHGKLRIWREDIQGASANVIASTQHFPMRFGPCSTHLIRLVPAWCQKWPLFVGVTDGIDFIVTALNFGRQSWLIDVNFFRDCELRDGETSAAALQRWRPWNDSEAIQRACPWLPQKEEDEEMIQEVCLHKGQWCYEQQPHQHSAIFTNVWSYYWSSTVAGPAYTYKLWRGHERYKDVLKVRWKFDGHLEKEWLYDIGLDLGTIFDIQGIWF